MEVQGGSFIAQCIPTHTSRVQKYLSEEYACKTVRRTKDLVFFDSSKPLESLLPELFAHEFLLRYVHAFYVYSCTSPSLDKMVDTVVSMATKESILRVKTW